MDQADSVHSTPHVCNLRRHRRGAVMSEEIERIVRIRRARNTPKSNMETRVALIVAERGLTEKQLAKYFVRHSQGANFEEQRGRGLRSAPPRPGGCFDRIVAWSPPAAMRELAWSLLRSM
jgi:hypothetical protein